MVVVAMAAQSPWGGRRRGRGNQGPVLFRKRLLFPHIKHRLRLTVEPFA